MQNFGDPPLGAANRERPSAPDFSLRVFSTNGILLSQTGQDDQAQPWYERAVKESEQGDVHGRVDHRSLG